MSFADDVRGFLPAALTLPDAFAQVFDWAEARGYGGRFPDAEAGDVTAQYLSIYPPDQMNEPGASYVLFRVDGPPLAEPIADEITTRCATIADAAGDGGKLALWLDDAGQQQFVIFNHGWPYVLTDDPLVALQFLGIGYSEPAALQDPSQTAAEQSETDMAFPPILPKDYCAFLLDQFAVVVPKRASDLGISIPLDDDLSDPARIWLEANTPEERPEDIPGMTAENPFIVPKDMIEIFGGEEGIAQLREIYPFVVVEK